jgi:hypothetical protein
MHTSIEKAQRAAGIGSLKRNYPENPKERGCGFWAAFLGVISSELSAKDAELRESSKEIALLATKLAALQEKQADIIRSRTVNGIEAMALREQWTPEKADSIAKKICG